MYYIMECEVAVAFEATLKSYYNNIIKWPNGNELFEVEQHKMELKITCFFFVIYNILMYS
jgi:hypothetical protein